jgi:hypothetical protein
MNIKTGLMIALTACIMLVGVAAANQENPEAGASWNTQATFNVNYGWNYVDGMLGTGDSADYWRGTGGSGKYLQLYIDRTALLAGTITEMCEGTHNVMQHIENGNNWGSDYYLNTAPVYVRLSPAGKGDYTFIVRWYTPS